MREVVEEKVKKPDLAKYKEKICRILVIGGSGMLGQQLVYLLKQHDFDVYATYHSESINEDGFFPLDITNADDTVSFIEEIKPDAIVSTAAFTNVDKCEELKDTAFKINVTGTKNVALAAEKVNAKMVYVSTDYIFNGEKGQYKETDKTDPIDYYGFTKLKGEQQVQNICSDFIIARTSVLYGIHKPNFVTWMISEFEQNKSISIVKDQIISPTHTLDISEQLLALIEDDARGIFHTAGGEIVSRYDFALKTAELFNFDVDLVQSTSMDEMNWVAKRPKNSSLNVSKVSKFKKPYGVEKSLGLLAEVVVGDKR